MKNMKSEIVQHFKGKINDVEFSDEFVFNICDFLLWNIESKFNIESPTWLIENLKDAIQIIYLKYDNVNFVDIENEFLSCIGKAKNFKSLRFEMYGDDWKFDFLNEAIQKNVK